MKADVVLPEGASSAAWLEEVYRSGAESLGQVIALTDSPDHAAVLRGVQDEHPSSVVLLDPARRGEVGRCNRGLLLRERDVVLLERDAPVTPGWLHHLLEKLHASDRVASVQAFAALLLRHWVINVIGSFDAACTSRSAAQIDWELRAQRLGLVHVRASRAQPDKAHLLRTPIGGASALLLALEGPGPLLLEADQFPEDDVERALLRAAAWSAQAVVTSSDEVREKLLPEQSVDAEISLRRRELCANFLRSLG